MKRLSLSLLVLGSIFIANTFFVQEASAASLKIAPLEYRTKLDENESKKGFIDISNPTGTKVTVSTSVQAFRQIDDQGSLEFYDDEIIEKGVKLDLDSFELKPREALRMFFVVDGSVLPSGNVFAAIFFTSEPSKTVAGIGQAVRLGTVLSVQNGTLGEQKAVITDFNVPFFQFGNELTADYTVKNIGDPEKTTGFYPQVKVSLDPLHTEEIFESPLVFAERSRSKDITISHNRFGLYKIAASAENLNLSRWVLLLDPSWTGGIGTAVLVLALLLFKKGKRSKPRKSRKKMTIPDRKKTTKKPRK